MNIACSVKLQKSYKLYLNTLKTIDFIEVLDNVTIEWEWLNRLRKYQESFLELLKIHSEEAILVRPDGHIAFKAENENDYQNIAEEYFLRLGLIN